MSDWTPLLVFMGVAVMLALGIAIGAALFFFQRMASPELTPMQVRLKQIKRYQDIVDQADDAHARRLDDLLRDRSYDNAAMGKMLDRFDFTAGLKKLLSQAGMKMTVDKFILFCMIAPFVLLTLLGMALGNVIVLLLAPGSAIGAIFFVKFKKGARVGAFVRQLPDALGLMTSALRAGHSFQSAMNVIASEMRPPIGPEFAQVVNDINLGIPVKDALNRMVLSMETPDVRMFVTAVLIQREAGGNLAEVLDKLGYTIRERFKLKGQISAATGQARMTGYMLGAAPVIVFLILFLFMPKYVEPLHSTLLGQIALGIAAVLQGIGFLVMKKIVDIRV